MAKQIWKPGNMIYPLPPTAFLKRSMPKADPIGCGMPPE